jgi:hypothetical protein
MKTEKKVYPLVICKVGDIEVIAQNPEQEELARDCIEYVRLSNKIDKKFTEIPWNNTPVEPWRRTDKHFTYIVVLSLELEQLQFIINKV